MSLQYADSLLTPSQSLQQSLFPIYGGKHTRFISWSAIQATGSLQEFAHLAFERHLGEGVSFVVDQYRNLSKEQSSKFVAVKTAKINPGALSNANRDRDLYSLFREIQILNFEPIKKHRNVLTLLGMDWTMGLTGMPSPRLVVEYAKHGTVSDFLKAQSFLDMDAEVQVGICLDIALGLQVVHGSGIIHGDLKLANILLFEDGDNNGQLVAKISDFGCALSVFEPAKTQQYRGTPRYRAPELNDGKAALTPDDHRRCDIYAFGLCIWELLKNGHPYYEGLPVSIENNQPSNGFLHTSRLLDAFYDCLTRMSDTSPTLRSHHSPKHSPSQMDSGPLLFPTTQIQLKNMYSDLVGRCLCFVPSDRYDTTAVIQFFQNWDKTERAADHISENHPLQFDMQPVGTFMYLRPVNYKAHSQAVVDLEAATLQELDFESKSAALITLADCHIHGRGTKVDFRKALQYLHQAAHEGSTFASAIYLRFASAVKSGLPSEADSGESILSLQTDGKSDITRMLRILEADLVRHERYNMSDRLRGWVKLAEDETFTRGFTVEDGLMNQVKIVPGDEAGIQAALDRGSISLEYINNASITIKTSFNEFKAPWLEYVASRGWVALLKAALDHSRDILKVKADKREVNWKRLASYREIEELPESNGGNMLSVAAQLGHPDAIKYLLANGVSAFPDDTVIHPTSKENCLHQLFKFADNDIPGIASILVEHGADPNTVAEPGGIELWFQGMFPIIQFGPPLMSNILFGNETAVVVLLNLGADPLKRSQGSEPRSTFNSLEVAAALHLDKILDILLQHVFLKENSDLTTYLDTLLSNIAGQFSNGAAMTMRWLLHGPQFLAACQRTIQICLKYGMSLNGLSRDGRTPLTESIIWNPSQHYVLNALLEAGADPNVLDKFGMVPLMYSARSVWSEEDNAKATRTLLEHGAVVDITDKLGQAAMHYHALGNSYTSLRILVDFGANVEVRDKEGLTPLSYTTFYPMGTEALDLLLGIGADMNAVSEAHGLTVLGEAARVGNAQAIRLLINKGASIVQPRFGTILFMALYNFRVDVVRMLVQDFKHLFTTKIINGQYTPSDTLLPIHTATRSISCLELLLRAGADIDADGTEIEMNSPKTALAVAISMGFLDSAVFLLERGASPFCRRSKLRGTNWTFLHEYVLQPAASLSRFSDLLEATRVWINKHDLLRRRNFDGHTVCQMAVHYGQRDIVQALVEAYGAAVIVPVSFIRTADQPSEKLLTKKSKFMAGLGSIAKRGTQLDLYLYAKLLKNLKGRQRERWWREIQREVSEETMDEVIDYLFNLPHFDYREPFAGSKLPKWHLGQIAKLLFGPE